MDTYLQTERKYVTMEDLTPDKKVVLVAKQVPAECVKRAQVLVLTDKTWHILAPNPYRAHGLLSEGTTPKVKCLVLDLSRVPAENDEKTAQVIKDCTAEHAGVINMEGLVSGLCALGGRVVSESKQ